MQLDYLPLFISLSLSHYHPLPPLPLPRPCSTFNLSPLPSPFLPLLSLYPFSPFIYLSQPSQFHSRPFSLHLQPSYNQPISLSPFLPNGIPRQEYEKILLIMYNFCFFILCYIHIYIYLISVLVLGTRVTFLNISQLVSSIKFTCMYTWLHNYGPHVHNTTCLLTDRWQTDRQMIPQTKTREQTDRQAGGRTDRQVCIRDWEIENLKYQILPSNMMISVHHTVYQSRCNVHFLPFLLSYFKLESFR